MCMFCGETKPVLRIFIIDNKKTIEYCPNCLSIKAQNGRLNNLVPNLTFVDDITNKSGAIKYIAYDEHYTLNKDTLIRLITHTLTKDEFIILRNKYGNKYMLHDDFYNYD
ncbi:MAG: hypothetical protein IJZ79_02360 [Bacilli bacterium]|nr:hypothetical protein [Bacilli bacterium]